MRIPAGQKHWHGASPQAAMTHIAISEHRDGTTVQWMEQVSDEQYTATPSTSGGRVPGAATGCLRVARLSRRQWRPAPDDRRGPLQQKVAPGMAALTDDVLYGDVWKRPDSHRATAAS